MKTLRLVPTISITILLCAFAGSSISAEPTVKMQADTCAMCHGTDGKSTGSVDDLFGLEAEEFIEEMQEFRVEDKGRLMAVIAKGYSESQIKAMARYFESLSR